MSEIIETEVAKAIRGAGAVLQPFSQEVMDGCHKAALELYAELNQKNPGSAPGRGVGAIMVRALRLGRQAAGMALLLTCGSSQRPARVSRLM